MSSDSRFIGHDSGSMGSDSRFIGHDSVSQV